MKKLLLLLLLPVLCAGQSSLGYTRIPQGVCSVDHTCRAEYKKDGFENTIMYKIGFYETALSRDGLSYIIFRSVLENKDERTHLVLFARKEGCITSKSYVHIQFKNGEKIKIPTSINKIDCGTSSISLDITDYLELLSTEAIEKIRVAIEYDDDFIVSENGQKKFFNNLKCIKTLSI